MNAHTRGVPSFLFDCTATVTSESRDCLPRAAVASLCTRLLLEFCAHVACRVVDDLFPGAQQFAESAVIVTHVQGNG